MRLKKSINISIIILFYIVLFVITTLLINPIKVFAQDNNNNNNQNDYVPVNRIRLNIDIVKTNPEKDMRIESAYNLAHLKPYVIEYDLVPETVNALIYSMVNDVDDNVKIVSAYSLGHYTTEESKSALIDIVNNNNTNIDLKVQALHSLSMFIEEEITDFFISHIYDENTLIRQNVCIILGKYVRKNIAEKLKELINTETDIEVKKEAITSLGKQRNSKYLTVLNDIYTTSNNKKLIIASGLAIYRLLKSTDIDSNTFSLSKIKNLVDDKENGLYAILTLYITGSRNLYNKIISIYNDNDTGDENKKMILSAIAESPYTYDFDILIETLSDEDYKNKIFAERLLYYARTDILVQIMAFQDYYYNIFSNALYVKLVNNTEIEANILMDFFRKDDDLIIDIIANTFLKLEAESLTPILADYIAEPASTIKINTIPVLVGLRTDEAFEIVKDNLVEEDSNFLIKVFKNIDDIDNIRLPKLFYSYLSSIDSNLRKQALISLTSSVAAQIDKLDSIFSETLGRLDEQTSLLVTDIKQKAITPLYSLFTDKLQSANTVSYINFLNAIRRIDPSLLDEVLSEQIKKLLSKNVIPLLNNYRLRMFYDQDIFYNLLQSFLTPIVQEIFEDDVYRDIDELKIMFIPTLSMVNDCIVFKNDVRGLILKEMENDNPEIVYITAENLYYTFRSLYKPIETAELYLFREVLGDRIIKVVEYIIKYKNFYEKLISIENDEIDKNPEPEIPYTEEQLENMVKSLERTLSEALLVDKVLYIRVMEKQDNANIISTMIGNIRYIRDYDEIKEMLAKMSDSENPEIRYESLKILSDSYSNDKFTTLFLAKLDDENERIRELAINTLAKIGDTIISMVINNLGSDNEVLVDSTIKLITIIGKSSVYELSKNITNSNTQIRKNIAIILGEIGSVEAIKLLLKMKDDEDESIQKTISIILINLGTTKNDYELISEGMGVFDNIDLEKAIEKEENKEIIENAIPHLIKLLDTNDQEVYKSVVDNLITIGKYYVDLLINNLKSHNPKIRSGLENVLINIDEEYVVEKLIEALGSDYENTVQSAINILSDFGTDISNKLFSSTKNNNADIRYGICNVLEKINNEKMIYIFVILLKDSDWRIITVAKRNLKQFGFTSEEVQLLSKLSEEEINNLKDMTIEEIREVYL